MLAQEWAEGRPALKRLTRHNAVPPLELCFERPFLNLQTLPDDTCLKGRFRIEGYSSTGHITGNYTVEKKIGHITITMLLARGWLPSKPGFAPPV